MTPRVLVITTVHSPDDTRIRERLIRTLSATFDVTYATKEPRPSDTSGLSYHPLRGGRLFRNLQALILALRGRWEILILHDPETIPAGIVARFVRRRPVVFDVHEDLPAQIGQKTWIPRALRPLMRWSSRKLFSLAERFLLLTLAEPGYSKLFKKSHPVFPNYPKTTEWPSPKEQRDGGAVYLGDVQPDRGISDAISACARVGIPLTVIGRYPPEFGEQLTRQAQSESVELTLVGHLSNPEAVEMMSRASVGLSPLRDVPNYRYSLPSKTLEYLAMGVPVVATDLPGTREVVGNLDAVALVPPGDIDAMAHALQESVTPSSVENARADARTVRDRFAWPDDRVRFFYTSRLDVLTEKDSTPSTPTSGN
ncbi:MAG: glycosyltransferase [Acidimicrobiia bacterium]